LPRKALVLQDDDPGQALALAAELREAGWVASVDLRGRNPSATHRAAVRQGYKYIVRREGARVALIDLSAETTILFDRVPSPDEVVRG
jgi:hypothetical protein